MTKLIFGALIVFVSLMVRAVGRSPGRLPGALTKVVATALLVVGIFILLSSSMVVIDAGTVGVQHAFGSVSPTPLLPGIRFVPPWSEIERYSTREEQWPRTATEAETMPALSSEQMSMQVDVALRWQIDPMVAPLIYTELGTEEQIHAMALNAIRKGVRDGMVQFSINDIAKRTEIAHAMEAGVDTALVTQPRGGGKPFRIATVTAFFLRNLEPPKQVVEAINNKIAQEQQIQTERHRVEVARLQSEQQKLLNQTLTAEQLMKQYLEVLHDMKTSSNLVVLVPTEGGMPLLDLARLRQNLKTP